MVGHFINLRRGSTLILSRLIELRGQYVDATPVIREVIEETIHHMPPVLINIESRRLYDKTGQAAAFEELPVYDELRSSMTTRLDLGRIQEEVKRFYRYVMFSHRWEHGEPLSACREHLRL